MNEKDPKDPKNKREPSEEELMAILEELKKRGKKKKGLSLTLGFMMHRNYVTHLVISLCVNFIISAVVFGLAIGIKQPIIEMEILGYILAIFLLTAIENFVKILLFKYVARALILSMGLLSVIVQIVILYIIDLILVKGFHFTSIEGLIVFAFTFSLLRLFVSIYIRRFLYGDQFAL
ncbi:MAG: hypothetical protein CVV61_03595 [Tenericutes bacterium HGW-Tenericutes-6]|nr:MAG: hypothetical protein CVV61_03595 [Tenericutes bacterium HGW-Tenericutes-6]